jgi:hypothetical protein
MLWINVFCILDVIGAAMGPSIESTRESIAPCTGLSAAEYVRMSSTKGFTISTGCWTIGKNFNGWQWKNSGLRLPAMSIGAHRV